MTREQYLKTKICRKCGYPLSTELSMVSVSRKYHSDCTKKIVVLKAQNKKDLADGDTTITCVRCERPTSADRVKHQHLCPTCEKELDAIEAAHLKIMMSLEDAPKKETDDDLLPPYLKGTTPEERQRIAYDRYCKNPSHRLTFRDPEEDESYKTLPFIKMPKKQPVATDTAPVSHRTRRDPETGQEFDVEVRGSGFYTSH